MFWSRWNVSRKQGGWWDGSGPAAGKTALHGVGVQVCVCVCVCVRCAAVPRRASQALGLRPLLSQTRSEALAWLPNGFPLFSVLQAPPSGISSTCWRKLFSSFVSVRPRTCPASFAAFVSVSFWPASDQGSSPSPSPHTPDVVVSTARYQGLESAHSAGLSRPFSNGRLTTVTYAYTYIQWLGGSTYLDSLHSIIGRLSMHGNVARWTSSCTMTSSGVLFLFVSSQLISHQDPDPTELNVKKGNREEG